MSNEPDVNKMAEALKNGIDSNAQDTPRLNIDPDSQKMAVVGDPNNVKPANEPYHLIFCYPADAVSEEDKTRMLKSGDEYVLSTTYNNVRVKPLYRTKVAMVITQILTDLHIMDEEGYSSDAVTEERAEVFVEYLPELAKLAHLILDVPENQLQYINAKSLVDFFSTILVNEPNILKEGNNFLSYSELQAKKQSQGN